MQHSPRWGLLGEDGRMRVDRLGTVGTVDRKVDKACE